MINRIYIKKVKELMKSFPCVAILGPRQVGKTTLAKLFMKSNSVYFDLELRKDLQILEDAETYLPTQANKLVIIDEIQRKPDLFTSLRAIIDQDRKAGRFLILGSASPDLIRNTSETLAGRVAYLELPPLLINEVNSFSEIDELWLRGGFPGSFLNKNNWTTWMQNFVITYLEKDLPMLGFPASRSVSERLWLMLANSQGSTVNYTDLSKSLEISSQTIKKYIDFLTNAFLVRQLKPYTFNIKKRVVKAPKVYIRDSGIFHYLLGIENFDDLYSSIKMGASWEGFVIEQIAALMPANRKLFFYRTFDGSELDLVIEKGGKPYVSIEIKYGSNIKPNKSNTMAIKTLNTKYNFVIIKENEEYELNNDFKIVGIELFINKYLPKL